MMNGQTGPRASGGSGRLGRGWVRAAASASLVVLVVVLLLVGALMAGNELPLPARWREAVVKHLSGAVGAPGAIGAVSVGITGVTLQDVVVDGPAGVTVQRVVVRWSPLDVVRGLADPLSVVRSVELSGLEAALPWLVRGDAGVARTEGEGAGGAPTADDGKGAGERIVDWGGLSARLPAGREIEVRVRDGRIFGLGVVVDGSAVLRDGRLHVRAQARRGVERLLVEGEVDLSDGELELAVQAVDVALADYVPGLARLGVKGRVDFSGVLQGAASDPLLRGTLAADGGRLFGQPFSAAQGIVELDRRRFVFERAQIAQGNAVYYLEGHILFGAREPESPAELELTLRTDNGRAEALLAALGWDVPVEAALAGKLAFQGPLDAVGAEGDVSLTHGAAYGQPFDRLDGRFRYDDGRFEIPAAEGSVRGGAVHFSGGGPVDGDWEVAVSAEGVPLQALRFVRERLPAASGLLDFEGVVAGGHGGLLTAEGRLGGRFFTWGAASFIEAEGRIAYDGEALVFDDFRMHRRDGGTYTVSGRVGAVAGGAPLALSVAVSGESLADLLALLDVTSIPAADGPVEAYVDVTGTLEAPAARLRVEAPDVTVVGRRFGLGMTLRWQDGRVEVEKWRRFEGGEALAGDDEQDTVS